MRSFSAAALLAFLALAIPSAPLVAQKAPEGEQEERPEETAREGLELLMRALRGFLDAVPQYGLPRIEENGDIVIPRLQPETPPRKPDSSRET